MAGYENHCSSVKFNKCFMVTSSTKPTGKEVMTFLRLMDAIEGKDYGTYSWVSQPNKKYWEVKALHVQRANANRRGKKLRVSRRVRKATHTYMSD